MKKTSLGIMLTGKCNAECAICGLSCSPREKGVVDEALMLKAIDEAAAVRDQGLCGLKKICFTGGEAFLCPELLVKGSSYAKEKGFIVSVSTNGFWGLWPKEKIHRLLSAACLDDISFSTDPFHREYVSLEAIKGAVEACRLFQLPCIINIGEARGKYDAEDFIRSMGELKYYVDLNMYPFYRVGRAMTLPADAFYPLRPAPLRCYDGGLLVVNYEGVVYPCCSPAVVDTCLSLGNLKEQSLADMLKGGPCVDLFSLLHDSESFQKLADIALRKGVLTEAERNLSPCEICSLMFGEKGYGPLQKDVADLYDELLTKSLFA